MAGNLFPHTITIQAKTTTNVQGGQVATYTNLYKNIQALVAPASSSLQLLYAQRNITNIHSVYTMKQLNNVKTGAIVLFGSRKFSVLGDQNILESGRLYQLDCREVTGTEIIYEAP